MAISSALVTAARNLITTFGNSATLYTYSSATTSVNEEGDITVSDWKTGVSIRVIDGGSAGSELTQANMGIETIGSDEKIVQDNVTIALNDRLTYDGSEFKVVDIRTERVEVTPSNILQK